MRAWREGVDDGAPGSAGDGHLGESGVAIEERDAAGGGDRSNAGR